MTPHELITTLIQGEGAKHPTAVWKLMHGYEDWFAYFTGYTFRGINIRKEERCYFVVVKAWDRNKKPVVTFLKPCYFQDAWVLPVVLAEQRLLTWEPDKYAK